MSQIPAPGSRLKAPSKILKPIQGGGGPNVGTTPNSAVKPRGAGTPKPTLPSSQTKTVVQRGSGLTSNFDSTPVKPRGAAAAIGSEKVKNRSTSSSSQVQPRGQIDGSKISFSRESSSSSLRSGGSVTQLSSKRESSLTAIKRRGSEAHSPSSVPASTPNFKIGDRVLVSGTKSGVLAYIGEPQFAKGKWAGVILDEPIGKNDGSVAGVRYFTCEAMRGIFTKLEKLTAPPGAVSPDKTVSSSKEISPTKQSHGLKVGDRVVVSGTKTGILKYLGETDFAKGEWAGIELDEPLGKNDGAVAGKRYFSCKVNHGLFAPPHKITKSIKQPKPTASQLSTPAVTSQLPTPDSQNLLQERLQNSTGGLGSSSSVNSQGSAHSNTSTVKPQAISTPDEEISGEVERKISLSSPNQVSSPVVALQEALQDRERQIKLLLEEREFERTEVANASSQVAKAEKELADLKEQHHQILLENQKSVAALQRLVENAEREKAELQSQLDDERKKVEDLQFQLEEEEITLGDELQTEQSEIKALSKEIKEKSEELQKAQTESQEARSKIATLETSFMHSKEELTRVRHSLVENEQKVKELEKRLSSVHEEQLAKASSSDIEMKDKLAKLFTLEKELDELRKKHNATWEELESNRAELKKSRDDSTSLKETVAELSSKLHIKEDEFEQLSHELEAIKMATLELQKQLNLSESKSEHLSADKSKLEHELSELMKNSGDNSQKLSYLTEQLKEKERLIEELKTSSAESQLQIDRLNENLAQTKKTHNEEVKSVKENHKTTIEALEGKITEIVQQSKQKEREISKSQETTLKEIRQRNEQELSIFQNQMKKKMEEVNLLIKELDALKQKQKETEKERDNLKEKCSKLQADANEKNNKVAKLSAELEGVRTEKEFLVGAQGDTEKQYHDMVERLKLLSEEKQSLTFSNTELEKNAQDMVKQLKQLQEEKNKLQKVKQDAEEELENTKSSLDSKQREIDSLLSVAAEQEEELKLEKKNVASEKERMHLNMTSLEHQRDRLQQQVTELKQQTEVATNNKNQMELTLLEAQKQLQQLQEELHHSKIRENNAKIAAESDRQTKDSDLSTARSLAQRKEEEADKYRREVESLKRQLSSVKKPPVSAGNALENTSGLQELKELLAATREERDSSLAQVDFLNSVIVDLKKKNEEAERKIEMLVTGEDFSTNGLLESADDEPLKPGFKQRLFCDICDMFDLHDTDDCPTQSSSPDDTGTQYHGSRTEERPYCDICEAFGHWTHDCDDEETF